jgi:3-oxoadipate enol-lactonase
MRERPDSRPFLGEISVPTLVIGGAEDGISSPEVMGEMAARIPSARHLTIPNTAHLSNLEAPEKFNAAISDFLKNAQ